VKKSVQDQSPVPSKRRWEGYEAVSLEIRCLSGDPAQRDQPIGFRRKKARVPNFRRNLSGGESSVGDVVYFYANMIQFCKNFFDFTLYFCAYTNIYLKLHIIPKTKKSPTLKKRGEA
jgi:hypothetical protein